jgi:hypothetical protein
LFSVSLINCRIPDDSIRFSRWPLFFAREVLGEAAASLKEKKGEEDGTSFAQECPDDARSAVGDRGKHGRRQRPGTADRVVFQVRDELGRRRIQDIGLGDERLNVRAKRLAGRAASLSRAFPMPAMIGPTQTAHRFLSNPRTDWQALLQTHWIGSLERMRGHEVALDI